MAISELPGRCSVVRKVSTIGLTVDTTAATRGFQLGYRRIETTLSPVEGAVSFEVDDSGKLLRYQQDGVVLCD